MEGFTRSDHRLAELVVLTLSSTLLSLSFLSLAEFIVKKFSVRR